MASCGLVRWPTHGQGASRELISSCRSAGVVSKQHHGPHHCCGRRRSNAEFESLCSRFVEHASTCTTQPLRSMVSATSMRKRRRGALREAPGSDSVRVPRAAHSSPVKLSIAYGRHALRQLHRERTGTDPAQQHAVSPGLSTDAQRRADGERYVSLEHAVWRIRHVFNWPSRQCLQRPSDVLYGADSFHFFDRFAPWGHNCSATTVLAGDACHADVMTAELGHLDAGILCSGVAAAQKLWFSELFRLPTELSRECQARLERIRTQQPG